MHRTTLVMVVLALGLTACTSSTKTPVTQPSATAAPTTKSATVHELPPAGPQSYTPETKGQRRTHVVTKVWSTAVGLTDHRSTMVVADGRIYLGTRDGVIAVDRRTGARRPNLPSPRGHVVGVALEGDRLYASSAGGELVASTRVGTSLFRVELGAAATTPPTLVDVDGDGTFEVAVGDERGQVSLFDGKSGRRLWSKPVAKNEPRRAIGAGLAAGDVDGDGKPEIIAGAETGVLAVLDGRTGETAWSLHHDSALRAAPILCDVDGDKTIEIVVGWADGDVAIVDVKKKKEIWSAHVEEDNGDSTGVLASPTPLSGVGGGVIVVPTARWGKEDNVVFLGAHDRSYKSQQGRVIGSPVLGKTDPAARGIEAVIGAESGDVTAFDAEGGATQIFHLPSAVAAPLMFTDVESDGTQELLVLTRDGMLTALGVQTAIPPFVGRARGSARNDGLYPPIDLKWKLP